MYDDPMPGYSSKQPCPPTCEGWWNKSRGQPCFNCRDNGKVCECGKWFKPADRKRVCGYCRKAKMKNNINYNAGALNAKAVGVKFKSSGGTYVYAWQGDDVLKIGDQLLVPARDEFALVTVCDLDVEFDVDSNIEYKFVVGIIELDSYEAMNESLEKTIKKLKKQRGKKVREEILAKFDLKGITFDEEV